jgi:hypothetical protein
MQHNQDLTIAPPSLHAVRILAPEQDSSFEQFLAETTPLSFIEPFNPEICQTLAALSQAILANPSLRQDAASTALAYWLRRSNLERLKASFLDRTQRETNILWVPVGQVFHLAPANVDTLFLYSWALSFICGNTNVVRLSEKQSAIVTQLLACLNDLMAHNALLRSRNRFITYPHDKAVTEQISSWCNHRIIWGGNETVAELRPIPLNPHASERVFSSKFSYAVLSSPAVEALSDDALRQLVSRFFNDMFWFDQMACSSPHIIFWVGTSELSLATLDRFNQALAQEVDKRGYQVAIPDAVRRLNAAVGRAADEAVRVDWQHPGFISLSYLEQTCPDREVCGGGLLRHVPVTTLDEIAAFADRSDQTISHFGLTEIELRQLAYQTGARGVDRLVPVGEALDFNPNWDGYDLVSDFLRRVVIKR